MMFLPDTKPFPLDWGSSRSQRVRRDYPSRSGTSSGKVAKGEDWPLYHSWSGCGTENPRYRRRGRSHSHSGWAEDLDSSEHSSSGTKKSGGQRAVRELQLLWRVEYEDQDYQLPVFDHVVDPE